MNEAELLFTEILNCSSADLYLNRHLLLDKNNAAVISGVLKRRAFGEPLQYITGSSDFFGLKIRVNKDVLIPRPETEILVETVLRLPLEGRAVKPAAKILDLATGSGCIAVALARHLKRACIDASDISKKALSVAESNAKLNKVKVNFIHSDLFASVKSCDYAAIVSNPPYIKSSDIDNLQPEVRMEPRHALDGSEDGLFFYRRIAAFAPGHLIDGGFLAMEIGFGQAQKVKNILKKTGNFEIIEVIKDYNNIDRVVVSRKI